MVTKKEILALVKSYVENPSSLETFSQNFAELFYDIEKTGDESAVEIAYAIEGALASVSAGIGSEAELLCGMKSLLPSISVVIKSAEPCIPQYAPTQCVNLGAFTVWSEVVAEKEMAYLVYAGTAPSAGFSLKAALLPAHQTSTDLLLTQQVLAEQ
jgi:hypothetical protein